MGHSSEIAWALWIAIATQLEVGERATEAVCQMDDSVVALLALDANSRNLMNSDKFSTTKWEPHMTKDGLYEAHWLLSYEAKVQNWLPTVGGGDHVASDQAFSFLKSSGVSFYDRLDPLQIPDEYDDVTDIDDDDESDSQY